MFGILKAVVETAKLPFDVAADVITLGGVNTDRRRTYTGDRCRRIMDKLNDE